MGLSLGATDYERVALTISLITILLAVSLSFVVRVLRGRQKPEVEQLHRDLRDIKHEVNNLMMTAQGLPIMNQRLVQAETMNAKLGVELGGVRDSVSRVERLVEMLVDYQMSAEGKGVAPPPTGGGGT